MARHCACPQALRPRDDRAILSGLARVRSLPPRYLFLRCHPIGRRTSSKSERSASSPTLHSPVVSLSLFISSFLCRVIPTFYSVLRILALRTKLILFCIPFILNRTPALQTRASLSLFAFPILLFALLRRVSAQGFAIQRTFSPRCLQVKNGRRARSGEGRSGRRCALGSEKGKGTCKGGTMQKITAEHNGY